MCNYWRSIERRYLLGKIFQPTDGRCVMYICAMHCGFVSLICVQTHGSKNIQSQISHILPRPINFCEEKFNCYCYYQYQKYLRHDDNPNENISYNKHCNRNKPFLKELCEFTKWQYHQLFCMAWRQNLNRQSLIL